MATSIIGRLLFQMAADTAQLKTDMEKAQATVDTAMKGMESAAKLAKTALGAIGIGLSVGGLVDFVKSGIDAEAMLYKLHLQTGITVETLSGLKGIAKQAGIGLDEAGGLVNKLEKNMLSFAQTGAGKAGDAFRQLGYTQEQVQAGLRNMDTFLPQFAQRLIAAGVGGEQAGLAMQLMARGGAAALPFLNQLAQAGTLHAKVTTEQAEAAHQFEVNLAKIQATSSALKIHIANELLPHLNKITEAFIKGREEGGLFTAMLRGINTAVSGDALHKANVEYTNLVEQLMRLEQRRSQLLNKGATPDSIGRVDQEMAAVKDRIAAVKAHRELLEHEQDVANKKAEPPKATGLNYEKAANAEKEKGISLEELLARAAMKRLQVQEQAEQAAEVAAQKNQEALDRQNEALDRQAQAWKDIANPVLVYQRQIQEINDLYEQGRLKWEEYNGAIVKVRERIEALDGKVKEAGKDGEDWGKKVGLTFSSAAEDAIRHWQGVDNLIKKILIDVAQIAFRKSVTEPIGKGVSGIIDGILNGGSTGGMAAKAPNDGNTEGGLIWGGLQAAGGDYLVDRPTLFVAGEAGPERVSFGGANNVGGGTLVYNQTVNIDARSDQAAILQAMGAVKNQTKQEILAILNNTWR